jgi:hypothetical protein
LGDALVSLAFFILYHVRVSKSTQGVSECCSDVCDPSELKLTVVDALVSTRISHDLFHVYQLPDVVVLCVERLRLVSHSVTDHGRLVSGIEFRDSVAVSVECYVAQLTIISGFTADDLEKALGSIQNIKLDRVRIGSHTNRNKRILN